VKRDRRTFVPYNSKPSVKLVEEPLLVNALAYIAVFLSEIMHKQTVKAKEIMATGKKQRLPFMVSVG
jgi:hypothetical protein